MSTLNRERNAGGTEVTGEIVHVYCWRARRARGEEHKRCAQDCIDKGGEMGLLTRDGRLYRLPQDAGSRSLYECLKGHVAEEVRLSGDAWEDEGDHVMRVRALKPLPPAGK